LYIFSRYLGPNEKVIDEANLFGINLGIAFQLIDDTLDFSPSSEKDARLDIENNLVSSVTFDYLDKNPELFLRYKNGENLKDLIDVSNLSSSVDSVVSLAHEYLNLAHGNLEVISSELNSKFGEAHTEEAITYLRLILSFLVLRKI
jgi:octaprenyl-diphosphate synthase